MIGKSYAKIAIVGSVLFLANGAMYIICKV